MPEATLDQFHFLRPLWLIVIVLAIWLHLRLRARYAAGAGWQAAIAPHLLQHLTVARAGVTWLRPYQPMTLALILGSIALAGPTWQRELTPFTQDKAPLVVALELTPTMLATDQAPTRLERAKQKIRDLLERRAGARTAVIAYAGSAHAVLPLTDDPSLIELYLQSLTPGLMPREGDDPDLALALAAEMLEDEDAAGTIIFMTDGIDRTNSELFAAHRAETQDQVLFLLFGGGADSPVDDAVAGAGQYGLIDGLAPGVDLGGTGAVADAAGGEIIRATPDQSDIDALSAKITRHLVNTIQQDDALQWRDFGYYLVWPLAFLILLWSRRGWTVQWG